MKPEEIGPHVGKGKRLVTVEVEIIDADMEPSSLDTLLRFGADDEFWVCGANIHSIRPVGEATPPDCNYLPIECPTCERRRVEPTGVCEKCGSDLADTVMAQWARWFVFGTRNTEPDPDWDPFGKPPSRKWGAGMKGEWMRFRTITRSGGPLRKIRPICHLVSITTDLFGTTWDFACGGIEADTGDLIPDDGSPRCKNCLRIEKARKEAGGE